MVNYIFGFSFGVNVYYNLYVCFVELRRNEVYVLLVLLGKDYLLLLGG